MIIIGQHIVLIQSLSAINALRAISGALITGTVLTGQPDAPGKALAATGTTVRSGNSSLIPAADGYADSTRAE